MYQYTIMAQDNTSEINRVDPDTRRLLSDLESCALGAGEFHHEQHVQTAWALLAEEGLLATLERFPAILRRFAHSVGADGLYHETITWVFLLLIHEHMQELPVDHTWRQFAAACPDLVRDPKRLLARYYTPGRLDSQEARAFFVLPDRLAPAPLEESHGSKKEEDGEASPER